MKYIKKYWWVFLVIILAREYCTQTYIKNTVLKAEKKIAASNGEVLKLTLDLQGLSAEHQGLVSKYESLKNQPPVTIVKKVPVEIEKIKYVKNDDYEETWDAWVNCEKIKEEALTGFHLCLENSRNMQNKQREIIALKDEQIQIYKEGMLKLARKANRKWAVVVGPGLSMDSYGHIRGSLNLTIGYRIL